MINNAITQIMKNRAKIFANRLKTVLTQSQVLRPLQYAVKGRNVTNGLVLLRDVINYLQTNHHDAYILYS